jgi:YggT family protein|uniref:YggT family protein n=1 Tax=Desulfobacca acetoxidans TaxID=60893 RepID=A0A7V6DQF9_9BACT
MVALGYFLKAVAEVLYWGLEIYMWLIIARALISWVNPDPYNPIVRFLYNVTEPVLSYLRRRFPMVYGGLDLSPLAVLAAIIFLKVFLVGTMMSYAFRLIQGGFG